jgi:phosphatidylglycerophosphate synthase
MYQTSDDKFKAAQKQVDGWWATLFAGPSANLLLRSVHDKAFITPNRVTVFSFLLGILASVCFVIHTAPFLILGALLVQFSFVVDCLDGQLARYRQQFSKFGAWLDRVSDRFKDFFYIFSLALGFYLHHMNAYIIFFTLKIPTWTVWPIAMLASFSIFLIDYYVNQDMKLELEDSSNSKPTNLKVEADLSEVPTEQSARHRFSSGLIERKISARNNSNATQTQVKSKFRSAFLNSRVNAAREEPANIAKTKSAKGETSSSLANPFFKLAKFVYQSVPILRFNIGEQALLISLFTIFGQSYLLLAFFAALGSFYALVWPVLKLKNVDYK